MQGCRGKAGLVVGCRGFPAQSVWKLLTWVGLRGSERKKAVLSQVKQREPLVGYGAGGRS